MGVGNIYWWRFAFDMVGMTILSRAVDLGCLGFRFGHRQFALALGQSEYRRTSQHCLDMSGPPCQLVHSSTPSISPQFWENNCLAPAYRHPPCGTSTADVASGRRRMSWIQKTVNPLVNQPDSGEASPVTENGEAWQARWSRVGLWRT